MSAGFWWGRIKKGEGEKVRVGEKKGRGDIGRVGDILGGVVFQFSIGAI